ncbi:MAG: Uma2 family endonuclease [Bryobacteraceae bacterium]
MATSTALTIDDFERLPDDVAENHELVDGQLIDVSGNTPRHNWLRDLLIALLLPLVRERNLGLIFAEQEYDFLGNAHGPDVSFFGPAKQPLLDLDKRVQRFVPDLAIEIASNSDTYNGLMLKRQRYLSAGVLEVWLISAETQEIMIFTQDRVSRLHASGVLTTDLLPGVAISVEELFRGL